MIFCCSLPAQVYKFKAFQTYFRTDLNHQIEESDWNNVDILVIINLDKKKIHIYAKKEVDLDIVSYSDIQTEDNGDKSFTMKAVDEDGTEMSVYHRFFSDQTNKHIASMVLIYKAYSITYRLKRDE